MTSSGWVVSLAAYYYKARVLLFAGADVSYFNMFYGADVSLIYISQSLTNIRFLRPISTLTFEVFFFNNTTQKDPYNVVIRTL